MILKDKVVSSTTSPTFKAGQKQEQDVAFFLRRHFKDDSKVFVFNDLKFKHNDETAQIDHLILYPHGFILIESKSITGEVSVNQQEEWSRSYNGKWSGMASPIKQVELQQKLLKELLFKRRDEILDTFLLLQQGFGGRCWDNLCAVSSNAIINRDNMPEIISAQLVKSEFLADKLKSIMKIRNPLLNVFSFIDSRATFNEQEMKSIADFLLANDCSVGTNKSSAEKTKPIHENTQTTSKSKTTPVIEVPIAAISNMTINCAKCETKEPLMASSGKFGYYYKCPSCSGNTPMKRPCPHCQSKLTKVSKKKETYTLNCQTCEEKTALHHQPLS